MRRGIYTARIGCGKILNNYSTKGSGFRMNITEFAKIAGVSKSAVSRYFNDGYLSDDKRKQIEDAVEKTEF